jgi:hypothetical protein
MVLILPVLISMLLIFVMLRLRGSPVFILAIIAAGFAAGAFLAGIFGDLYPAESDDSQGTD